MEKGKKLDGKTKEKIKTLAGKITRARSIVAFTGAGISTESGIPDYRSQGGLWDKFTPVFFDEFMSDKKARIRYWAQRMDMEKGLKKARPNKGHRALAKLFKGGKLTAVITQNIDGLHHESGIPGEKIIELHGNTRRVRCMSCGTLVPWADAEAKILGGDPAPECSCGGYLKPDTVSFGQAMPEEAVQKAVALSRRADLFLVVGSTLLVQPASLMPFYARESGAFLSIVNLSATPMDKECDLLITAPAGPVLEAAVKIALTN